jgi:hypothetical protein
MEALANILASSRQYLVEAYTKSKSNLFRPRIFNFSKYNMPRPHDDEPARVKQEEEDSSILSLLILSTATGQVSEGGSTNDSKRRLSVGSSDEGDSIAKKKRERSETVAVASTVKTELKDEQQEGKEANKRPVFYYDMGVWAGHDWHIIGDGRSFQFGFRNSWTDYALHHSHTLALPDYIGARKDILDRMPASTPFWEGSGLKSRPKGDMRRRIANYLLDARARCDYADAQDLIEEDGSMYRAVLLSGNAKVTLPPVTLPKNLDLGSQTRQGQGELCKMYSLGLSRACYSSLCYYLLVSLASVTTLEIIDSIVRRG